MKDLVPTANSIKCALSLLGLAAVLWTKFIIGHKLLTKSRGTMFAFYDIPTEWRKGLFATLFTSENTRSDKRIKASVIAEFT